MGYRRRLAGLAQCQDFEQFVERSKAPRKGDQGVRAHRKMHLPQGEVMKLERQLRRAVAIGDLLPAKRDVEANGGSASFMRAAIGKQGRGAGV
jgi:hypothetical protein